MYIVPNRGASVSSRGLPDTLDIAVLLGPAREVGMRQSATEASVTPEATVTAPAASMTEEAYRLIKRAILRCELAPGQQVSEEQLAERFALGRAAVRPALKRLYQEQLVQTITRNRYVVSGLTLKDAHDIYETRQLLEPEAARLAASRITPAALARLRAIATMQYIPGDAASAEEFLAANSEFHLAIARASGNQLLAELIATVLDRSERLNNISHLILDRNHDARTEHLALIAALAAGDSAAAEREMRAQVESARRFVLDALTASPSVQSVNVALPARRDDDGSSRVQSS